MSQYYWNAFYAEQAHEGADAQNTIALNSRLQRLGWDREWEDLANPAPNGQVVWSSKLYINGYFCTEGWGTKKGHARDDAARQALPNLPVPSGSRIGRR